MIQKEERFTRFYPKIFPGTDPILNDTGLARVVSLLAHNRAPYELYRVPFSNILVCEYTFAMDSAFADLNFFHIGVTPCLNLHNAVWTAIKPCMPALTRG